MVNGVKMKETNKVFQVEKKVLSLSGSSPQVGGPKTKVRVHLGVQEQPAPKMMPKSHTESVLDIIYMDGKIISRSFQWLQFEAQIRSESTGVIETRGRPESVIVLRHHLLGCWPVYRVGVHDGRG